ncbi:MAG TPA: Hpt domain-containing protein [Acetobacteraceae bacterium]|jgi:HPt (histidine-containing phosphotransfer) domain-containing protein
MSDIGDTLLDEAFLEALAVDIGADGVAEAARIFLDDAPARVLRWRQGETALRREAHALAGSARAVGLSRLGEAASTVQRAVEAGAAGPDATRRLETLLAESTTALEVWLAAQRL